MSNPIVLIHGYSDKGESFLTWKKKLQKKFADRIIHVVSYRTLTNEVSIKDIAEAFDRALKLTPGLDEDEDFDAIVHSTGMLVIRSWLTTYPARRSRLKRLIGLAPASFGSPLATLGRSTLGSIFKGNKEWGPDFLEAGDMVLDGLELASRFTWDLAHQDLLGEAVPGKKSFYGPDASTPYIFIFCGNKAYSGLRSFVNEPGTDGTVRWAGCSLNTRKFTLDLTHPDDATKETAAEWAARFSFSDQQDIDIPVVLVDGLNHGSIIESPMDDLVQHVADALAVDTAQGYQDWQKEARVWSAKARSKVDAWQQFVIHAVDERGDGIPDYNVQVGWKGKNGEFAELKAFDMEVHNYKADPSFRSFHVNLTKLFKAADNDLKDLCLSVIASTGTQLVAYLGYGRQMWPGNNTNTNSVGMGQVLVDLGPAVKTKTGTLFYPFTTTLIEIVLNREPMPLNNVSDVCWMLPET